MKRTDVSIPAAAARSWALLFAFVFVGCLSPSTFHADGGSDKPSGTGAAGATGAGGNSQSGGNVGNGGSGDGSGGVIGTGVGGNIQGTAGAPAGTGGGGPVGATGGATDGKGGMVGTVGGAGRGAVGGRGGAGVAGATATGGGRGGGGGMVGGRTGAGGSTTGGAAGMGAAGAAGSSPGVDGGVDAPGPPPDASAPDVRVCVPEQCNGRDDDCDGVIDDGCPIDQQALSTRTPSTMSAVFGSLTQVRNVKFTDACPDGQVIIGFIGNSGSAVDALGVRCGTLEVHEDRAAEPFQYTVVVTAGTDFSPVGGEGGAQNLVDSLLLCGPNQMVVAVRVTAEPPGGACATNGCAADTGTAVGCPTVYGLAVSCGRYNIVGAPGAFRLALASAPTLSERAGGPGRAAPPALVTPFACSATGALRQISGTSGPWAPNCAITVVTGLQFGCTDATIPVR